ncbi:MAG: ATP-grasp domain-containing protein, partial [Victivallales bacterium]|nr:ATP-grasp domain-containing protein [Victivallales bacterium]
QICADCNIKFIGPKAEHIRSMGDKAVARDTMIKAKVPVTPGSDGIIESEKEALEIAHRLKYPVIIKASAGGGGRGMRIAHNDASLIQGYHAAKMEAENAFGNGDIYVEKYLVNPKHIEFQIIADDFGNVVHLGERDCSVQRRNQKLIEESPSAVMTPELRKKMGEAACKAAKAVGYTSAGTIEFLLDAEGDFYFMEMNTRIQVEHPVTEQVTGIDLIQEMIRVAAGEKLSFTQKNVEFKGHAIECRINAENPYSKFTPSPGKVTQFSVPGGFGVRIDSHVYPGYSIPPYYDSMIAKLIVYAPDRKQAIERCKRAIDEFTIEGVKTTLPFARFVLGEQVFAQGTYNTGSLEDILKKFENNEDNT